MTHLVDQVEILYRRSIADIEKIICALDQPRHSAEDQYFIRSARTEFQMILSLKETLDSDVQALYKKADQRI